LDLLQNWDKEKKYFVKVMPKDLKRVLEEKEKEQISQKVFVG